MTEFHWGLLGALAMLFITKIWEKIQKSSDTAMDDLKEAMQKNTDEIKTLTHLLIKFEGLIERLDEKVAEIPEMKKDINILWQKFRASVVVK